MLVFFFIVIPIVSLGFLHLVFMIEERLTDESYL